MNITCERRFFKCDCLIYISEYEDLGEFSLKTSNFELN